MQSPIKCQQKFYSRYEAREISLREELIAVFCGRKFRDQKKSLLKCVIKFTESWLA